MLIRRCFTPLRLIRFVPTYNFSRTLSESAQRAVWASKIVQEILSSKPPTTLAQQSLRDHLLGLQLAVEGLIFDKAIKDSVLTLFTTGVELNETVYNQTRIKDAKQAMEGPFIFCPNYLVTQQMFQILSMPANNQLVMGAYGTSKTVSIILFNNLASIINRFRYEAYYDKSDEKKRELECLQKHNLIEKLPKYFYWNVTSQSIADGISSPIKKLILEQTTEMIDSHKKTLKKKLKNHQKFHQTLEDFYTPTGIERYVAVGQINIIASHIRRWNHFLQDYDQERKNRFDQLSQEEYIIERKGLKGVQISRGGGGKSYYLYEEGQPTNETLNFKKMLQQLQRFDILHYQSKPSKRETDQVPARQYGKRLTEFRSFGQEALFNSSLNIQKRLINTQQYHPSMLSLELSLDSHQTYKTKRIQFQQSMEQEWGKTDFLQFFWFEFQRRIQQQQVPQGMLKELKQDFISLAQSFKFKKHNRFFHIFQIFDKEQKQFLQLNSQTPKEQILKLLSTFIEFFYQKSIILAQQKLKSFLSLRNKGVVLYQNERFLSSLFFYAVCRRDSASNIQMTPEEFSEITDKRNFLKIHKPQFLLFLRLEHFNQLIIEANLSDKTTSNIQFVYSPSELVEILEPIVFEEMKNFYGKFQSRTNIHWQKQNNLTCSGYFARVLCDCFLLRVTISIEHRNEDLIFNTIQEPSSFLALSGQKMTLEENFEDLIALTKQHPGKFIAAFPYEIKNGRKVYSSTDKTCDLVLASNREGKTIIHSVDVTVELDLNNIQSKRSKAESLYSKLFKQNTISPIEVNHIILCPSKVIQREKTTFQINPNFKVIFSPLENLRVLEWKDDYRKQFLENFILVLKEINRLERVKK